MTSNCAGNISNVCSNTTGVDLAAEYVLCPQDTTQCGSNSSVEYYIDGQSQSYSITFTDLDTTCALRLYTMSSDIDRYKVRVSGNAANITTSLIKVEDVS